MPETESETDCVELPADPEKRESMKTMAAAAVGVAMFTDASWWPFGGGVEDALRILNDGEPIDDGVEELDFGNAIAVQKTEDGVQIDVQQDFTGDVTTDEAVGVGTRNPDDVFSGTFGAGEVGYAVSGSGTRRFAGEAFSDGAHDALWIQGARYRGTAASPSAVQDGDLLLNVGGYGYDGSGLLGSSLRFRVDGPVSDTGVPTKFGVGVGDANGNEQVAELLPSGAWQAKNGALQSLAGGATYGNGALELGSNGARLEVNASGEVVVIDEAGNETLLS